MTRFRHHLQRLLFAVDTSRPAALGRRLGRQRACTYAGDDTIMVQTVFGHLVHLDARDISLLPSLVVRGYWEPGVTRALLRLIRPGQRVVEVGANVGWYSLLFAAGVGSAGSVTAFEANPRTVELLRRTLAANGYGGVQVVPLAVTDAPGQLTLHRLARQQGSSSLYPFTDAELAGWYDTATPQAVEATSLDAFLGDDGPPVDLVKIDAEGAEPAILAGMTRLLTRSPRVQLVLEFLPALLARAGHDPGTFLASLVQHGFRLHTIDDRGGCRPTTVARLLASSGEELYLRR
ncbi:MAG TPA: FkbM family methyltransferase [Candidatus Binatia bacterium]|jgi:FkbM family methyltransferase|nr:FkbM family methyltransferase [Candidatus Binatia bacterium]